ncbi:type VII toxin-antitoxin system HepT family RNase toxin [Desulfofundulus thermocisternus]|uniref:type VII toxin-antitoxin system HepT family RNase toxin n=1 Tax=Desulfofundulus thermocisternus TaxID=42471 RepID=UPI000485ABB0|nr:HepT-like ribonuclease domain-containing protein [Desulfofundulus thermocisternus]
MPAVAERLPKELLKIPAPFYERHGVELAFLFGSAVGDPPAIPRDLDVAVLFSDYHFQRYLKTFDELSALIKRRDVDLVALNLCSPALKMEALTKGILLYSRDEESFARFATDTFFDYEDYLYFKYEYNTCWRERAREGLLVAVRRLNRERIETCLSQMDQAVQRLKDLRARFSSYEEFTFDLDTRDLCVHHLRIALESVLDICRHFLAVKGVALSEYDTTSLIELAGERGLLDHRFARRIKGMAGMRNAIVHVYWRLDYRAIYKTVTEELGDFEEFARQVTFYLEQQTH